MKNFTVRQFLNATGGKFGGNEEYLDCPITSVERDSRQIKEGSLFLAIKGARVDGHNFIEKCYERGAVCALCEHPPKDNCGKSYIIVNSTLEAVKAAAEAYRMTFDIPIVGVSGSVGKTSTKEMIAAVLGTKLRVHKTEGNLNNELGVPLTLFGLEEYHQAAVVEMGISDFGEMRRISKMVKPNICIITVIGSCHLENLGDLQGVLRAKTEMFENIMPGGKIILNGDDNTLRTVTGAKGISPVFYGTESDCAYRAEDIENEGKKGVFCKIIYRDNAFSVKIPAIGSYMVSNALAAAAAGDILGLEPALIARGIENYKTVGSRANIIETGAITVIDDCYNANPNSVKAALDTLSGFEGRKVAILGDMKELGKNELDLHYETGKYSAQKADLVIAAGPLAREIYNGAKEKGVYFASIEDMLKQLSSLLKAGDVTLVKASHSMEFSKIVDFLTSENFSI